MSRDDPSHGTLCPTCGKPLPGECGLDTICPSCLLSGIGAEGDLPQGEGEPAPDVSPGAAEDPVAEGPDPASGGHAGTIAGHTILEEIDTGGMGVVYKVREPVTGRIAALKMLQPQPGTQAELRERFRIEAMALASLDDPGILPLYRFGEDRGRLYFTMRYAGGGSLATRMRDGRAPATPREAAELVIRIARAVGVAHSHGILHRDLKPGNILFDEDGNPQVADFGLARITGMGADLTRSGGVFGTPMYMAPEAVQKGSRHATTRSDVYSLGAILYQLLTSRAPFHDPEVSVLLLQITGPDRPDPPSRVPGGMGKLIPRDLETICLKALEKEPSRRYPGTRELEGDLRRWLDGYPIQARPVSLAGRIWRWTRRNPALAVSIGLLAASLAAASVLQTLTLRETRQREREARAARQDADGLVRTMTTTHADLLEPLGRLDVLDAGYAEVERYYSRLPEGQRDSQSRANEALFLLRRAEGLWQSDRLETAAASAERALAIASELSGHDALVLRTRALKTLGIVRARQGRPEPASALLREAMEIAQPAMSRDAALACEFAGAAAELGRIEGFSGRTQEAVTAFQSGRSALAVHRNRAQGAAPPPVILTDADCLLFEGMLYQELGGRARTAGSHDEAVSRFEQSLSCFREAARDLRDLCATAPDNLLWLREANLTGELIARSLRELGPDHFDEALEELRQAQATAEKLAAHNLTNLRWQRDLAGICRSVARLHEDRFRHALSTGAADATAIAVASVEAAARSMAVMVDVVRRDNRPQWMSELAEAIEISRNLLPHLPAEQIVRLGPQWFDAAIVYSERCDPAVRAAAIRGTAEIARAAIGRLGETANLKPARDFWARWTAAIAQRAKEDRGQPPETPHWHAAEATLHRAYTDACTMAGQPQEGLPAALRAAGIRSSLLRAGQLPDTGAACHAIAIAAGLQTAAQDYDGLLQTVRGALDLPGVIRRIEPAVKPGWRLAWVRMFQSAADVLYDSGPGFRDAAAKLAADATVALEASDVNLTREERVALDSLRARTQPGYVTGSQNPSPP